MELAISSALEIGDEMAEEKLTVAQLGERVNNYKWIFSILVSVGFSIGFIWMGFISRSLYDLNGTMGRVERAQADAPLKIVASILGKPSTSPSEVSDRLDAVSTILKSAQIMRVRPDGQVLAKANSEISIAQNKYPDLPATWRASASFINYKSATLITPPGITPTARTTPCQRKLGPSAFVLTDCAVDLENLLSNNSGNTINGKETPFTFVRCVVNYHGGRIPATRMVFSNSIFQFQIDHVPDLSGMLAMRQMTLTTTSSFDVVL